MQTWPAFRLSCACWLRRSRWRFRRFRLLRLTPTSWFSLVFVVRGLLTGPGQFGCGCCDCQPTARAPSAWCCRGRMMLHAGRVVRCPDASEFVRKIPAAQFGPLFIGVDWRRFEGDGGEYRAVETASLRDIFRAFPVSLAAGVRSWWRPPGCGLWQRAAVPPAAQMGASPGAVAFTPQSWNRAKPATHQRQKPCSAD